MKANETYPVWK